MKQVTELVMWTLFFSSLSGLGITAGFFCFIAVARLLGSVIG